MFTVVIRHLQNMRRSAVNKPVWQAILYIYTKTFPATRNNDHISVNFIFQPILTGTKYFIISCCHAVMLSHFLQSRCLLLPVYTNLWTKSKREELRGLFANCHDEIIFCFIQTTQKISYNTHWLKHCCQFSILARTINIVYAQCAHL